MKWEEQKQENSKTVVRIDDVRRKFIFNKIKHGFAFCLKI